jgi:hypothetical protein
MALCKTLLNSPLPDGRAGPPISIGPIDGMLDG